MATRSGSNSIPFWGVFGSSAFLPNVAGSPTQKNVVEIGDQAFTSGDSTFWVCVVATVGAAAWQPIAASTAIIIYQPGGTPSSRVFTTFPTLQAAVAAFPGPVTIYFDDSIISPIVLPAGAWVITNPHMIWRGLGDYIVPVDLQLADGFVCSTTGGQCALGQTYGDVAITALSVTTPPFPITQPSTVECYGSPLGSGVSVLIGGAAAGCLFEVTATQLGVDLYGVQLGDFVFSIVSASTLFLSASDGATDNGGALWLRDDGSGTLNVIKTDGSATFNQNQTGFSGAASWANFTNNYLGAVREAHVEITHSTGAYNVNVSDRLIEVDTSTGTISTLTLPDQSADPLTGLSGVLWVEDVGGVAATNPITVAAPGGGGTINGAATFVLSINNVKAKITTKDGLHYFVDQMTALDPNLVKARSVTGNTDTLTVRDFLVEYSNAGAVAVSLPALGAPPAGTWWVLFVQQTNAATIVTVTPATSIDGATPLVFPTGIYSASLRSKDGSVWYSR